jgi:hypothetical protein
MLLAVIILQGLFALAYVRWPEPQRPTPSPMFGAIWNVSDSVDEYLMSLPPIRPSELAGLLEGYISDSNKTRDLGDAIMDKYEAIQNEVARQYYRLGRALRHEDSRERSEVIEWTHNFAHEFVRVAKQRLEPHLRTAARKLVDAPEITPAMYVEAFHYVLQRPGAGSLFAPDYDPVTGQRNLARERVRVVFNDAIAGTARRVISILFSHPYLFVCAWILVYLSRFRNRTRFTHVPNWTSGVLDNTLGQDARAMVANAPVIIKRGWRLNVDDRISTQLNYGTYMCIGELVKIDITTRLAWCFELLYGYRFFVQPTVSTGRDEIAVPLKH